MTGTKKLKFKSFLRKARYYLKIKGVSLNLKTYFVDAMSVMALGLFSTLLIGTIFSTIASYIPGDTVFGSYFDNLATYAKGATGIVLGISVAYALKAPALVMFSAGVVGMCGNALPYVMDGISITAGPAGAFICALVAVEIGKLVSKTTRIDIILTPTVTIGIGVLVAMLICPAVAFVMYWLGYFINTATVMAPLIMGIIISVTVGMILTLPISSAAICAMIGISGLAGGAATAGCCAQMVGFAIMSYRENKTCGLIAQGLGTSMLQMGNIVKNPLIWLPVTLSSAITGPIATCIFKLECTGVSAGMGTCGLVGPIGIFADMGFNANSVLGVVLVCLVLPAILSLIISEIMRKFNLIKENDLKLEL